MVSDDSVSLANHSSTEDSQRPPYLFPFLNLLDKVPLPPIATYASVALLSYLIYLGLALATGVFVEAIVSFMHLQQISFSVVIFAGLFFGRSSSLAFDRAFAQSRVYFDIDPVVYTRIVRDARKVMGSWYSLSLAIPFTIMSSLAAWGVSVSIPDRFFPVSGSSPVFVYYAFVEFSAFCLYLLCSLGFWFLLIATNLFRKLENFELRLRALRASSQLYELPGVVFKATIYLFTVMSIALPSLTHIVLQYKQFRVGLWAGSIGLGSVYAVLLVLASMAQYVFHRLIIKAKYRRLDEISDTFERIQVRIEAFPNGFLEGEAGLKELGELVNLNSYLLEVYHDTPKTVREWLFDLRNLGQLFASGLIPIASFISLVISLFE